MCYLNVSQKFVRVIKRALQMICQQFDQLRDDFHGADCCVTAAPNDCGGGQVGQNLPPPVPYSPASRTFISRLPPVSVLLPSPVNRLQGFKSHIKINVRMAERFAFVTEEEINLQVDRAVPENTKKSTSCAVNFDGKLFVNRIRHLYPHN